MKKIISVLIVTLFTMPVFAGMSETMSSSSRQTFTAKTALTNGRSLTTFCMDSDSYNFVASSGDHDSSVNITSSSQSLRMRYYDLGTSRSKSKELSDDLDMEKYKGPERDLVVDLWGKYKNQNGYSSNLRSQLSYNTVPVPGALLLGGLGIGCITFLRRRCNI